MWKKLWKVCITFCSELWGVELCQTERGNDRERDGDKSKERQGLCHFGRIFAVVHFNETGKNGSAPAT